MVSTKKIMISSRCILYVVAFLEGFTFYLGAVHKLNYVVSQSVAAAATTLQLKKVIKSILTRVLAGSIYTLQIIDGRPLMFPIFIFNFHVSSLLSPQPALLENYICITEQQRRPLYN